MNKQKLSKKLSYVLRHDPGDLYMDAHGWVFTDDILESFGISMDELEDIVETNDKKRFLLSETKSKIKCVQGHTVNVELELGESVPPDVLYHGTSPKNIDSITMRGGLSRMDRHHVHLSKDLETAFDVGKRHSKELEPVVLKIDAFKMHEDGFKFYCTENGVWLTENVPTKYFKED